MKEPSKTKQAIQLMDTLGITAYEAATRIGVSKALIYRAIKNENAKVRCTHCGGEIKPSIDNDGARG